MPDGDPDHELLGVLRDAARAGSIGSGDLGAAIEHARGFLAVLRRAGRILDLGTGGGLPGLVLAIDLPDAQVVLLDASQRRTDALHRAVGRLDLGARVTVVWRRAEELGREPEWRASQDAVVARSFGPPGVVAECAAAFLRVGGPLVVSEPPEGTTVPTRRWPPDGLALLGLRRDALEPGVRYASCTQISACPKRFPRRSVKQPLF